MKKIRFENNCADENLKKENIKIILKKQKRRIRIKLEHDTSNIQYYL